MIGATEDGRKELLAIHDGVRESELSWGEVLLASDLPQEVQDIAWKAQKRLNQRYRAMNARGKRVQLTVTAIARELCGFTGPSISRSEAAGGRDGLEA